MRKASTAVLAALIWATSLLAIPPSLKIVGPEKVDGYKLVELSTDQDTPDAGLIWDVDNESVVDAREYGGKFVFTGPPGVYHVKLRVVVNDKTGKLNVKTLRYTVTIGVPAPTPTPGPTPGPTPTPTPTPDPVNPAPIPLDGFRVLMVYESKDRPSYPAGVLNVLEGKTVRDYLDSHCVKGPGGEPERRIWDQDTDGYADAKHWGDAMKRPRSKLPWVVISTGKTGYEGPLPTSPAECLDLLKKYGGN